MGRGPHRGTQPEKGAAASFATPNTGRGSHPGPARRRRGSPRRDNQDLQVQFYGKGALSESSSRNKIFCVPSTNLHSLHIIKMLS
ncbi:hypothetical protein NDU88_007467 [Pleurodeles waltl]|uniref:Uncharacterized protein n=1 Tax=Pleurodeles waltl TaxID=8319 RepID=A0AAV7QKR8_PLEWA|nr:hypothetical protein NDU88_007467 [Pleurodeles waltl]